MAKKRVYFSVQIEVSINLDVPEDEQKAEMLFDDVKRAIASTFDDVVDIKGYGGIISSATVEIT